MSSFPQNNNSFSNSQQPQSGFAQQPTSSTYGQQPARSGFAQQPAQTPTSPLATPTSPLANRPTVASHTPPVSTPTATYASTTVVSAATVAEKKQEIVRIARELFRQSPDWVTFFREVLGAEGVVRRLFTAPEALDEFEKSSEYGEIQLMIAKLRERSNVQAESKEPTRVITVRLPKSLHESLRVEAHSRRTSMNKLCISKLLQVIDNSMIPND
ncbi:MAG: hypothetical protein COA78_19430 [Blastopirellula sp.]|nr:MAG: hypothetical protein COA78_19430 [Blastopirellula sp.]